MDIVKYCTLYSGSSANSSYIEANGRGILVDAGGGIRKTMAALKEAGGCYENLEAIFITHEHSDHIRGLCPIANKYKIPVIANKNTLNALSLSCPDIDTDLFREMPTGSVAIRNDFEIVSFSSSHDSAESVGYIIKTPAGCLGVLTDLGEYSDEIIDKLSPCKALVLESNHDENMLWNGPYHYSLKKRIGGQRGHLSNRQCGTLLQKLAGKGLKSVILAHLSLENNKPELAFSTVSTLVSDMGAEVVNANNFAVNVSNNNVNCESGGGDLEICVAPRNDVSKVFVV